MKYGEIRIIGGKWRSRRIRFPLAPGLRPTIDRVRETVFNWLSPYINQANCLDLFAGSGALGIEALSRGAKSVTFIDNNSAVIENLNKQLQLLGATEACTVVRTKIPFVNILNTTNPIISSFDIIFIDPPFHKNLIAPVTQWLEQQPWVRENAIIYLESEAKLNPLPIPPNWEILHSKTAGESGYHLLKRHSPTIKQ